MRRTAIAVLCLFALAGCKKTPAESPYHAKDSASLRRVIDGFEGLIAEAKSRRLLALADDGDLAVQEREEIRQLFASFLDYVMMLDGYRLAHSLTKKTGTEAEQAEAFLLAYAADLALYVNTARVLDHTVGRRNYEKILDEGAPELGIPAGAWEHLKRAFTKQPWKRPLLLAHLHHKALEKRYAKYGIDKAHKWAVDYVHDGVRDMVTNGTSTPKVTALELADLAKVGFQRVWFPAQTKVATWMGDTRVHRKGDALITIEQIHDLRPKLRAGDVLVERRNWYLSNVGLPGFWTHAALYLGTPEEAARDLGQDALDAIAKAHPEAFAAWQRSDEENHAPRVIEAMSEGVVFTSLEHSAAADYLGVLRPKVDDATRARAVEKALEYHGRPYDFDFDFLSDKTLVCTELVYKSYEPGDDSPGLELPLARMMGRPTLPANELVRHHAIRSKADESVFEFVAFLDGVERSKQAVLRDEAAFLSSCDRPRWDLVQR